MTRWLCRHSYETAKAGCKMPAEILSKDLEDAFERKEARTGWIAGELGREQHNMAVRGVLLKESIAYLSTVG